MSTLATTSSEDAVSSDITASTTAPTSTSTAISATSEVTTTATTNNPGTTTATATSDSGSNVPMTTFSIPTAAGTTSDQSSSLTSNSSETSDPAGSSITSTKISTVSAPITTTVQATSVSTSNGRVVTTVIESQSTISAGAVITSASVSSSSALASPSSSTRSSDAGAIIGGVVGGVAGLAVVLALVIAMLKRRRRQHDLDKAFEAFDIDDAVGFDSGNDALGQGKKGYRELKHNDDDEVEAGSVSKKWGLGFRIVTETRQIVATDGRHMSTYPPRLRTQNDSLRQGYLEAKKTTASIASQPHLNRESSSKGRMNDILVLLDDDKDISDVPVLDESTPPEPEEVKDSELTVVNL